MVPSQFERRVPNECRVQSEALSRFGNAHDQRVALPAATAQRGRAHAATATLELQGQVQHDPGAGHADRVAQGDRAAVDVDLGLVEAERARGVDADRRERLVELDQVEVGRA